MWKIGRPLASSLARGLYLCCISRTTFSEILNSEVKLLFERCRIIRASTYITLSSIFNSEALFAEWWKFNEKFLKFFQYRCWCSIGDCNGRKPQCDFIKRSLTCLCKEYHYSREFLSRKSAWMPSLTIINIKS